MLTLNLPSVSRGEVTVEGAIAAADPLWEGTGLTLLEPLTAEMRARQVGEGVLLRGRLRTRLALECRRCLDPVEREIADELDLLFEPLVGEEAEELGGEVYALPPRGSELDLAPVLREQLLLRVPEHVVCRDECRGLCPRCGADRNRTHCDCAPEQSVGAWDALKQIKFD